MILRRPHGIEEIKETFGNISNYIDSSGKILTKWEYDNMGRANLPEGIPLAWDTSKLVSYVYCHKHMIQKFEHVFRDIHERGYWPEVKTYGGCYTFRSKRTAGEFSTHSWGIAVDLNPATNGLGMKGDMAPEIVDVFKEHGFLWGGDWRLKDAMHFQYCSGY